MRNQIKKMLKPAALLLVMMLCFGTLSVTAEEGASSDDSLDSLGITTEGYTIDPEFYYSIIEYNVTVPGGTAELSLDPVTSNEYATILDISGTEIEDGSTTVSITVEAQDGSTCTYYLYVTVDPDSEAVGTAAEVETEEQTEKQTETETETEDSRYVSVDRDTLEEAENTIAVLKEETSSYRDRVNLLMIILYALIAVCVILLFIVINLLLRRRDMKAELNSYRDAGYQMPEEDDSGNNRRGNRAQEYTGYDPYYGQPMQGGQMPGQMNGAQMPGQMQGGQMPGQMNAMPQQQQMNDDPSKVPKPEDAQSQPKKMPGYEQPQPDYQYEPPKEGDKKKSDVNVDMIDL